MVFHHLRIHSQIIRQFRTRPDPQDMSSCNCDTPVNFFFALWDYHTVAEYDHFCIHRFASFSTLFSLYKRRASSYPRKLLC